MAQKRYRMTEGGMHERFSLSRKKLQIIGGGFGNGKTAATCVKALQLVKDYPSCNGLIARSTYPKLNDTIRKEFMSWAPKDWVKRGPVKDDNSTIFTNGSVVNFRYVQQKGATEESTTSNLLSATYDWIIVDQLEDPEFVHKDFMDLMGRLRGSAVYEGSDSTMPKYGPQWIMVTLNPTRNWCYRELIKPMHDFAAGVRNDKLLCEVSDDGEPILDENGRPTPLGELFEGSTYENVDNVGIGYIKGMLSTYNATMRDRFVFGKWGALSGLVYPEYDEPTNMLPRDQMRDYLRQLQRGGFQPNWLEAYDHGLKAPSCYMLAFVDDDGNIMVVDGFHNAEQAMEVSARKIHETRDRYGLVPDELSAIYADPSLFKRHAASGSKVGDTVAGLYQRNHKLRMQHGANDIASGIAKVGQYLTAVERHEHPLTGEAPAPYLYIADDLTWFNDEITEYYWKKDGSGQETDEPKGGNDHAMDATKYLLTSRPKLARFVGKPDKPPAYLSWHEIERQNNARNLKPRHR